MKISYLFGVVALFGTLMAQSSFADGSTSFACTDASHVCADGKVILTETAGAPATLFRSDNDETYYANPGRLPTHFSVPSTSCENCKDAQIDVADVSYGEAGITINFKSTTQVGKTIEKTSCSWECSPESP